MNEEVLKETLKEELKETLKRVNKKLINADFKDKQEMDNLTFEREKLSFGLEIYKKLKEN